MAGSKAVARRQASAAAAYQNAETLAEEQSFRHLVQSITDYAIYMLSLTGTVATWNAGAERVKGYRPAEIIGQHFSCFYTAEDQRMGLPAEALRIARVFGRFETEGWRVRKDGSRFWAHVVIDLITTDDGEAIGFAKITRDRTESFRTERAILESERRFRHLVQSITDYAVYMLDLDGIITNWNLGAERAKGYKAEEIIGRHFSCFYTAEDKVAGLPAEALRVAREAGRFEAEGWRVRKDGSRLWAHVFIDLIRDDDGQAIGFAKITRDITEQKADTERLKKVTRTLDIALANMTHGLCVFDTTEGILLANRRFRDMFGYGRDADLVGTTFTDFLSQVATLGHCCIEVAAEDACLLSERHAAQIGERLPRFDSRSSEDARLVLMSHRVMEDGSWVSTFEDITERRRKEEEIARLALQDSLTGLANRRCFITQLEQLLAGPPEAGLAVLLIDLDGFKSVNDTYGHPAGDAVLVQAASRIRQAARAADIVARLGGDEFGIISRCAGEQGAVSLSERLIAAIRNPCEIGSGVTASVGASVGIAVMTKAHATVDTIIAQADLALYEAKSHGKSVARVFSKALQDNILSRRELETEVRTAFETGEGLSIYYHPIIALATGTPSGFEARLRWRHSRRGVVAPSVFIPIVEDLGLMGRAGLWMLQQACSDASIWNDAARVSVRLSALQLRAGFAWRIEEILNREGFPASRLDLEMNGVTAVDEKTRLADLRRLKDLGVQFSLADVGAGPLSLAHLLRIFPFDRIKIARGLPMEALATPSSAVILEMVVELGRRLGLTVLASGVDTQDHLDLVARLGCHEATGRMIRSQQPM